MEHEILTVTEFNQLVNQTLVFAYPLVVIEGEVASYKINQKKWVFFDLKDEQSTISCFMTIYNQKFPLEDGMLVRVSATPNLTKWGKFSLTVKSLELSGEGSVKKAFELLKARLEKEGLFALERKRPLPLFPKKVALITSKQAAAYTDFVTIVSDRWAGLTIDHAQVQVQGSAAPDQITKAIEYFNTADKNHDVLVVIRGGGSLEDLQAFNHEDVVRAVFGSKIPTLIGIGHEDDISLAELAADQRAATPTDAARRLVPDRKMVLAQIDGLVRSQLTAVEVKVHEPLELITQLTHNSHMLIVNYQRKLKLATTRVQYGLETSLNRTKQQVGYLVRIIASLNPKTLLKKGYSIATLNGRVIKEAASVRDQDLIMLQLHRGSLKLKKVVKNHGKTTPQTSFRF